MIRAVRLTDADTLITVVTLPNGTTGVLENVQQYRRHTRLLIGGTPYWVDTDTLIGLDEASMNRWAADADRRRWLIEGNHQRVQAELFRLLKPHGKGIA